MFSRELAPSLGIVEAEWERNDNQTSLTGNRGDSDVMEIGDPFWTIDVKVTITSREQFDEWDSFFARRKTSEASFLMWRSLRVRPRDLLITSDAGLGLASIDEANSQITLSGYGAGRQAHYGDMIGYRTAANGYYAVQVVAPATADGAGNITLSVWPRPWVPHVTTPDPRRFRALAEFKLTKKPKPKEAWHEWDYRFEAQQVLA